MPGIPLQQTLALQVPGNAVGDGVCQMGEFIIGWCLDPSKPQAGIIGAIDVNTVQELPVDLNGRFIYYVGPVDPVGEEVVGPAGPTTATRMDKFTRVMLEKTGLMGMIGKAERGPAAIDAIRDNKAVYLIAVGGAAYLVAQAIKSSKVLGFPELGMEAIYEFEVKDMPVTVAVDVNGESVHKNGPQIWRARMEHIQLTHIPD